MHVTALCKNKGEDGTCLQVAIEHNLQELIQVAMLTVALQLRDGGGLKQVKLEEIWAPNELCHCLCGRVLH